MIASFSPYFMKSSFDITSIQRKKKRSRMPPSLFTQFYKRVNQIDRTTIEDTTYNECKERTQLAEKIEANGLKFKKKEIIMNNLVYEKDISLDTLSVLCNYYKVNIIYIKGRTFVKLGNSDKPFWMMNEHNNFIEDIDVENYLEVSLEKPLKSVSYYLLAQLQDMSRRLLLPVENYKKQELYNSIKQVLVKLYKIEE
jgi:hypothetical protein